MGLNGATDDSPRAKAVDQSAESKPAAVPAATAPVSGTLTRLLGAEDSLFRDPFADFAPSGR
jgi:hypothetical protein